MVKAKVRPLNRDNTKMVVKKGGTGGMYGLAFIGALFYYLNSADSFWMGLLGIVKAIFWPAFLVYHLLGL